MTLDEIRDKEYAGFWPECDEGKSVYGIWCAAWEACRAALSGVASSAPILTNEQILAAATREFPDWRMDIQEQFVLRIARAALGRASSAPEAARQELPREWKDGVESAMMAPTTGMVPLTASCVLLIHQALIEYARPLAATETDPEPEWVRRLKADGHGGIAEALLQGSNRPPAAPEAVRLTDQIPGVVKVTLSANEMNKLAAAQALALPGICQPNGLMFDALGEPRVRYVRVTLDGSHMVTTPRDADDHIEAAQHHGDDSVYTLTNVYLSEREFEDLPEFDGF